MTSAVLSSRGRITIPKEVRAAMGLKAGDRINFMPAPGGGYAIIPAVLSVQTLKGIIALPAQPVSLEDMDAAIASSAGEG